MSETKPDRKRDDRDDTPPDRHGDRKRGDRDDTPPDRHGDRKRDDRDDTPPDRHGERRSHKERKTIIVAVNTEQDEEARIAKVEAQAGEGWRVIQKVPISGGGAGPGGNSEHFMRLQVTLERTIDGDNVVVRDGGNGD